MEEIWKDIEEDAFAEPVFDKTDFGEGWKV